MPWTLTVTRDPDKADVGSATATFVEAGTTEPVFTHTDRLQLNAAGRDKFFDAAWAKRNEWRARIAWEVSTGDAAQELMNSRDPNPTL